MSNGQTQGRRQKIVPKDADVKDVDNALYELSGNNEGIWSTYCYNDV